ncbi:cadherin EGF LAG seven-pass G-type receptor 1 isoform X2 [Sceloporus undulatus]|uniref:cadherin EGF LAG seven-pass G-type receptor 1 isoform X2 n=1 Tax=Sceloporus undulatus TaxID=8520 RepID=UPI001C4D9112|nr:cadherin EGF LAG seven-pass G-type receptor 1 isoform X2 [Sceloporus undulatus]
MLLRWPAWLSWVLLLLLGLGLLGPGSAWELHLRDRDRAGTLLLDLSLGPGWCCALDQTRSASELRAAVEASPDGRLRRSPRPLECLPWAPSPQPFYLLLASPEGALLSLRLPAFLHGPGCLRRRAGEGWLHPQLSSLLPLRQPLPSLLCLPAKKEGPGGLLLAALRSLTSLPQCRRPDGQPWSCKAQGGEGKGQPIHGHPRETEGDINGQPHSEATSHLQLLCPLRRSPGLLLLDLKAEGVGKDEGKGRNGEATFPQIGARDEGNWDVGPRGPRRMRSVNNPPQFRLTNYQVSIAENQPADTAVITLEAHDPDEGEAGRLVYSMEAFFDKRSNDFFAIDAETGVVVTTRSLDRETKDTHVLQVTATDHGTPRHRSATTFLTVTVSDTNDHSPVFEQPEYRENIRENLEVGYEVLTIRATDKDAPDNANLLYRILEPGAGEGVFEIDPHSGVVRTCAPVDREEVSEYHLVVEANDQGKDPGPRSATVTVHITVEDENDNSPQFSEKRYLVQIPEDTPINNQVLQVQATDRDRGSNAQVHYSIVSGNLKGQFYIHSFSGSIDLINPLDYETIREYTLRIKAQDGGRPPQINSSGMVSIQILDVNDNAPIFVSTPFQATVLENVPLGYSVLHIQAVDADSGDNARLEYRLIELAYSSALVAAGGDVSFPFQINNSTGWITVSAELDRETVENYHFGVEARDHGVPVMTSSASVSITVLDVNDNSPTFTEKVYHLRLNEDATVGSSVLALTAVDKDVNSVVTYQITSGNTRNRFAITSQSAGGLITLALPLDYKQERQYVLTVTASDGTLFDTVQVFINVTDANTHRPVFQSSHYTVSVSEDKPVGTSIVTIVATDEDTGENARITYVLEDSIPQFRIDPDTGTITTLMELDYEDQASYTLAITAQDNGIPQKSDTTYVEILILDANDNVPRFLRDRYQGTVFEDVPLSTSVLQVSATDRDSGPNGRLLYTFQGGDDGDGDFYIEATSGVIRTLRKLDRENVAVYSLRAFAVDRGSPPLKASVDIQVTVLDINDNPPVFEQDEFDIYVEENSPVGSIVARISAVDPDEGTNAQIMYQIVEGNIPEVFQLDLLNGDLTALMDLDYESQTEYVIVVQATSAPLVSRATVHIRLRDQNDNPPVLQDFQILFNNYVTNKSNSFPSGVIGKVPAHDPDISDRLDYTFVQGNELNLLLLDSATGELKLSRDLDNNRPLEAIMKVSVSDGIHNVTALCTLRVTIITDDMLTNSITVRLENMSQEKFLSPLLALFVEGVATVLSTTKEGIFVFNIQNDTDVNSNILNVTFSALLPGGIRNEFFPSEDLQEQIYLNRTLLTLISNQRVLPFDDNICLREPCENYMKCVSVLKFDSSAPFISSNTVLFRPIHPINGLRCRCPPGFTGDYCETEIDLCYSNPCGNNGLCRSREGGYTCECYEDYTGESCEVNARSGRCAPGVCKNGGTCINLLIGGFKCECPPGEFERPYCEMTTRSFPPQSFVTFKGLRQRFHFTVSLTFATREKNALLLYNGRFNEKHDFIALEIIEEQIQLTFSAGETTTTVAPFVPGGVSDGQWHSVQVQYYNKPNIGRLGIPHGPSGEKVAVVTVDDCDTAVAVRFGSFIGNYSCAAQGTQTGSKKSLDLTGPLLLGGVPNLPEDFPVHNRQFVGCMRNLSIDSKPIDMASYIANNGTLAGCLAQKNYCTTNWCQNGGRCVNKWNTYSCECPLQYGGKNCEQVMPFSHRFTGESIIIWSDLDITISVPWYIGLMFRTRKVNGMLMQANAGLSSKISIQILNKYVVFEVYDGLNQVASLTMTQSRVSDGEWHHLLIELKSSKDGKDIKYLAVVTLDYGMYQSTIKIGNQLPGLKMKSIIVGGVSGDHVSVQQGFYGCLQGVRMGETSTNVATLNMKQAIKINVKEGCEVDNPCDSNPCPQHSYCSDDWDSYSCICDPGYFGTDCVDVCSLNPCEHVSTCVRKPSSSHGYTCQCGQSYYGQYCESKIDLPCPRGWWGNPICGPCNCEISKGFDPDCNKTNGECRCKANYYRPQNSDTCYPCDCFPSGSHSRICDMETGQCPCKAGVIGRQCNRCDNPFAEVTVHGCEVVYNGCPKAFEAGIWWPQTKFGQPAAVHCPKGSVGNAVRHCNSEKGWLPPELFNCTTVGFMDLKIMNEKLLRNETNMDGDKSVQIAKVLQNATNHIGSFYGNDVRTAYQMMIRVLQYESQQQGFDLAATKDVDFNENIIRAGSALLEPSTKEHWEHIQRTEGGTAHLLKHYEDYFINVAKNMQKTYMKPFIIVATNIIIAVDIFEKSNFTGAKVPRFDTIKEDYPRDLESSVLFPDTLFKASNRKVPTMKPSNHRLPAKMGDEIFKSKNILAKRKRRHPEESNQHAVAIVIIYRTLGEFLPENYDPDRRSLRLPSRPIINTPIISTIVYRDGESLPDILESPITLEHVMLETEERTKPVCVFWNHSITIGETGGWSSKGCELFSRSQKHVICQCNHLTSFAVLMDISKRENGEALPLKIITYTTVSISLAALLLTFILLVLIRTLRSNLHSIHKNLVAALFFSELVFLIGINQTENPFVCTVIAILLHYFYMSTFAWMFVEQLHIYRMLTEVRNINFGHMRFYYVMGWGIPAIITGLAVGLDPQGYGNPDFCWLSVHDTLIWSFAGPIVIVVVINIIIFILAVKASCRRRQRSLEKTGIISVLRTAFLLLLLISGTWLLGLMAVNSDVMTFHYLFAIFSCLQGLFIFFFHCIFNKEVRKHLKNTFTGKKPLPDDSTTTRATLLTRSLNCNDTYIEEPNMYRTTIGESTVSLESTVRSAKSHNSYLAHILRDEAAQKLSVSSSQAKASHTEGDSSIFHRKPSKSHEHDSDSDSELSLDEHSSSYASSHSSDSEEDAIDTEKKWNTAASKSNDRGPLHSTPKVESVPNHVKPYWPSEGIIASDGEEPNAKQKLKVETKVNVELHRENQGNHSSEIPQDKENEVQQKENKPFTQQNHQQPEQRKGILKNKVTYPPPLVDKNVKNRLREKLSDYNQTTISSRMTSIGTNNGVRANSDSGVMIKSPRRDQPPEQINGLAMNVHVGAVTAETSDSEGSNETSI